MRAIAYAEEKARMYAKTATIAAASKLPAADKLDIAASYFHQHASVRVSEWIGNRVLSYIESLLPDARAETTSELISVPWAVNMDKN
jgi:hypothetical protein